ncbi:fimbrial protein [Bacteroides fluxus]|jgi:hypothetical protein
MKKINFCAMALAALTMFSCTQEESMNLPVAGEKANVTLNLKGEESAGTRATGSTGDDTQINNYIAFFFNEQGQLVTKHEVDKSTSTGPDQLTTTTAATEVYIVANVGKLDKSGFGNVVNKDQIAKVVKSLNQDGASTQTSTNVWMEGTGDVAFTENRGAATVILKFLAAKVTVTVVDQREGNTENGAIYIKNDNIVLLNAGGDAKFFDTDKTTQTNFFSGAVNYPGSTAVEASFLSKPYAANGVHFYAFGNASSTQPTILAIQATRTEKNGGASTVYYPIAFSKLDAGANNLDASTFAPGYSYEITLTLKGNVAAGGGNGTVNPEQPLVSGTVEVTIQKAEWVVKSIGKEFS